MRFHCDNPTCAATVYIHDQLKPSITRQQIAEDLAAVGWSLHHDSVNWVAVCPRCTRDLAHA